MSDAESAYLATSDLAASLREKEAGGGGGGGGGGERKPVPLGALKKRADGTMVVSITTSQDLYLKDYANGHSPETGGAKGARDPEPYR